MPTSLKDTSANIQLEKLEKLSLTDKKTKKDPERMYRPSASYLGKTIARSQRISTPQSCRKLIILDLNGTLLLRGRRETLLRPYMPAFRSFIFHDAVKSWLDAMVWSSAQPHNVKSMVEKCFATNSSDFKAVWARDTLGLLQGDYHRKVETVKDLEKPWAVFKHSAETTVLIDDSLSKAQLQPYNHICVPDYTHELRYRHQAAFKRISDKSERHGAYDNTLLAVIGVLDEIKSQSNVASWIRTGGLWAGHDPLLEKGRPLETPSLYESDGQENEVSAIVGESSNSGNAPDVQDLVMQDSPLWFEHPPCLAYWVKRGESVAASLDIQLDPGKCLR